MIVLSNLKDLTPEHIRRIRAVDPRVELFVEANRAAFESRAAQAEVLLGNWFGADILAQTPKLRWVQSISAGVEHLVDLGLPSERIALTNASGIHRIPMAEHILGVMLMWARDMHLMVRAQMERRWPNGPAGEIYSARELAGQTLGVVGLGEIGDEAARRAKAFDMNIIATRRHLPRERPVYVDKLVPIEHLHVLLAESDFVLISMPLTPETRGFIGEPELRAMKPDALLINISRGAIIDEPMLVRALREGWIGGGALDVFVQEPLPADHELYELPNVIITPHMSGQSRRYFDRVIELFADNVRRYLAAEPLRNAVSL